MRVQGEDLRSKGEDPRVQGEELRFQGEHQRVQCKDLMFNSKLDQKHMVFLLFRGWKASRRQRIDQKPMVSCVVLSINSKVDRNPTVFLVFCMYQGRAGSDLPTPSPPPNPPELLQPRAVWGKPKRPDVGKPILAKNINLVIALKAIRMAFRNLSSDQS